MKKTLYTVFIILILKIIVSAQGTSGADAKYEYRNLIDMPTAGVLEKGYVGVSLELMPFGVLISKIEVGVFENLCIGISYGGSNIIGSGKISGFKLPGVNIRGRIFNETEVLPALTLGFDSQGKGEYNRSFNRYQIKSPGLFFAASKNFDFYGYFSVHGIINYSLESEDNDKDFNLAVGFEKTLGAKISIVGEYDFAINDNSGNAFGDGTGFLNLALRWSFGDGLTLGVNLRDLLDNKKFSENRADRGLFVEYIKAIF
jgi:hypothetical protein